MQAPGRVGEQVAVLVNRAALGRYVAPEPSQRLLQPAPAVNNQELWLAQPALDETRCTLANGWFACRVYAAPMISARQRRYWSKPLV